MSISLHPVRNKKDLKKFIKSQWKFYKDDPNWVPPVIQDRLKLLNTEKNPFFRHSEIEMIMAERDGEVVGRIAAITNENHNKTHNDNIGFFGFFECIDDQQVADMLFDAAAEWLRGKGKDAMRGPEDPSQNDVIGTLIEGFDSMPVILMPYNPPYYLDLIDNAGFGKAKDLYAYYLRREKYMTQKMERVQKIVRERYDVTIREVNFKNKEQFRKDVETLKGIYNKAWEPNWGFVKMTDEEFDFLAADLKQFAESKLTLILEVKGEPAGFALALPDIHQALVHNRNGGLIGAIWHLLTKKKQINQMRIIVLGIIPEYQKIGVDSVLYWEYGNRGPKIGMPNAEASWVLEDNTMMNRGLTVSMNGDLYKKYRLYEKKI